MLEHFATLNFLSLVFLPWKYYSWSFLVSLKRKINYTSQTTPIWPKVPLCDVILFLLGTFNTPIRAAYIFQMFSSCISMLYLWATLCKALMFSNRLVCRYLAVKSCCAPISLKTWLHGRLPTILPTAKFPSLLLVRVGQEPPEEKQWVSSSSNRVRIAR